MIDPINPGPAGYEGPAGAGFTGPNPADVTSMLSSGAQVYSGAISQVLRVVQEALQAATNTISASYGKLAQATTVPLNQASTVADLSASTLNAAVQGRLSAASLAGSPAYTADQGAPNYSTGWNIWSVRVPTGWSKPIPEQYFASYKPDINTCFRGWAQVYEDALALAGSLPELPPNACPQPSFVINPPTGGTGGPTCDTGLYQVWQQVIGNDIIGCQLLCSDSPGPSGGVRVGNPVSLDIAQELMQSIACTGAPTGGGGETSYYAGCVGTTPVVWASTDPTPAGVQNQVGPFGSQADAQKAAPDCTKGPGTGNGTGGTGNTGTGTCACNPDGSIKLPTCIDIDLCDWGKFTKATKDALCEWSTDDACFYEPVWRAVKKGLCEFILDPKCQCPTHDSDRWMAEDCDGQFTQMIQGWFGQAGANISSAASLDDLVDQVNSLDAG